MARPTHIITTLHSPQPTAEPTEQPTLEPSGAPSSGPSRSPVVVSRWYPKALVVIGADGCERGTKYLDLPVLANWVYMSERECCLIGEWCTVQDDNNRNVDPPITTTTTTTTTTVSPPGLDKVLSTLYLSSQPSFLETQTTTTTVPSKYYPSAFIEAGALGCEHGTAHTSVEVLSVYSYDTLDECCDAWPLLCEGTTTTTTSTTTPDDRRYYPRAFVETGSLGCEHGTAYKTLTSLSSFHYATLEECCGAFEDLCVESDDLGDGTVAADEMPLGDGMPPVVSDELFHEFDVSLGDEMPLPEIDGWSDSAEFFLFSECSSDADCDGGNTGLVCDGDSGVCLRAGGETCETGHEKDQCATGFVCDENNSWCNSVHCRGVCTCDTDAACPDGTVCAVPGCGLIADIARTCVSQSELDSECHEFFGGETTTSFCSRGSSEVTGLHHSCSEAVLIDSGAPTPSPAGSSLADNDACPGGNCAKVAYYYPSFNLSRGSVVCKHDIDYPDNYLEKSDQYLFKDVSECYDRWSLGVRGT